ncbi:Zn(II)2Cys6 transcription factor [Exophiala viscosa]|uniref:Zn(II)2Cys6 transcription factor n=1 Tax=Exophiala viscosa TaxID=2486360 RepID=A0AAN6DYN1_9EURO|nr:Zn(II)2Cys6 transcription factor [Exophiala viscosa]
MAESDVRLEKGKKRSRAARACELCRAKKYRCDEMNPCSKCKRFNVECVYKDAEPFRQRIGADSLRPGFGLSENARLRTDHEDGFVIDRQQVHDTPFSHRSSNNQEDEISEINPHTLNREYHGPTSSLAFLAALDRCTPNDSVRAQEASTQALVSALHNDTFSPQPAPNFEDQSLAQSRYYFRQSRSFLDGYFENLHFIHPLIDRSRFLARCEDLWFGRVEKQSQSFIALYFAVMALGALTREWNGDSFEGLSRWTWSRKMFEQASINLGNSPSRVDLETVQANIIMAKVCQNELNPHLAYMYLGLAVRTSLSAGHNRQSRSTLTTSEPPEDGAISKTWWGLFSLEIETSFALGRPDCLGADIYHNRALPLVEDNETAILTPMVDLARIIRKISVCIYLTATPISTRIEHATRIETEMDKWVLNLPKPIRPQLNDISDSMGIAKDPMWAKKQRHTLKFRYYNVKMVLYRPCLLHAGRTQASKVNREEGLDLAVFKCVTAARNTIRLMHQMYCHASYFRTWWYNTTYTLYAASIILGYLNRIAPPVERTELLQLINMSIEVLDAMEENVVARKAAKLLQRTSTQIQESDKATEVRPPQQGGSPNHNPLLQPDNDDVHDFFPDLPWERGRLVTLGRPF